MPRMLFDSTKIDEMQQRRGRGVDRVIQLSPFLVCQPRDFDESGRALQILLKEHRGVNAARPPLQYRRPVLQKRHDQPADMKVIAEQIKLSDLFVRPVNALEMRQRHMLAIHIQQQLAFWLFEREKLTD